MEITQRALPFTPWADPALSRLPGMRPVTGPWIIVDDAYDPQMAERARILAAHGPAVLAQVPGSAPAVAELWEHVLDGVPDGFRRQGDSMICPDGRPVDLAVPGLRTLAHLLQEDLLLLQRRGEEHVLIAGVLCFPASWTLAEKMGRPLSRIHRPVPAYDDALAGRVQRLFDHVRPGRPLWRANALGYADAALYQPMTEAAPRPVDGAIRFLRSERQTVLRLPKTGAILFAVHTYVVPVDRLTPEQRDTCPVL